MPSTKITSQIVCNGKPHSSDSNIDPALLDASKRIFRKQIKSGHSLTDCTSFALMKAHSIKVAVTGDRHFRSAGFQIAL